MEPKKMNVFLSKDGQIKRIEPCCYMLNRYRFRDATSSGIKLAHDGNGIYIQIGNLLVTMQKKCAWCGMPVQLIPSEQKEGKELITK